MSDLPLAATETRPPKWVPLAIFLALAVAACAALAVDLPLARWLASDPSPLPSWLRKLVTWSEAFAEAKGVAIVALAVYLLDPAGCVRVPRLLTMAWGGGLVADLAKLLVRRLRPREFTTDGGILDTFGPLLNWGHGAGGQGFPSAHAASAVGLCVALCRLYPRGRWLFVTLAMFACFQRMASNAHFLSDVLAGSAIGYLFARWCIGTGPLARAFDRLEARCSPKG